MEVTGERRVGKEVRHVPRKSRGEAERTADRRSESGGVGKTIV